MLEGMRPLALALSSLSLATVVGLGACDRPKSTALPGDEARALLLDRNWIDRLPEKKDDRLHVFRFVPSMGGGVFQDRTIFFGTFELFQFEHTGDEIRFALLHTGERKTVRYRIEPIDQPGPDGFDLKLILDGSPRGPSVYYGWRKEGATERALVPDLPAIPK
jgi:hypothetical protein